jgi:nitroimidazol reductase NimA-like FMN-containing flavoprotein (pyridoxamine 5'-phosphate oxidase superfamily)
VSAPPRVTGRHDLALADMQAMDFLRNGFSGCLGSSDADGWPYVVPLLYVYEEASIFMHQASRLGHLSTNLEANPRACFAVNEPGRVYGYGRFECDSSVSYTSVIAFGVVEPVTDPHGKELFCRRLMAKYATHLHGRPTGFFPRLDAISVFALRVDRLTGKEIPLPAESARWPRLDRTRSPGSTVPKTPDNG